MYDVQYRKDFKETKCLKIIKHIYYVTGQVLSLHPILTLVHNLSTGIKKAL